MENALLELEGVSRYFGGLAAVSNLSLTVSRGQLKAIIGPNGSGKTTLFNVISMIYPPQKGSVKFKDRPLNGLRPHAVASLGVVRTFQNIRLFAEGVTAIENVIAGQLGRSGTGTLDVIFRKGKARAEYRRCEETAMKWLDYVGLASKANLGIHALNFGEQRALELARALAADPELILLDEPAAGLNETEARGFSRKLLQINRELNKTICLVEHNIKLVMGVADQIMVMNYGEKLAEGNPDEIRKNEAVIKCYLGEAVY
ncbi:MAG: ABC transporter ATP-binding protein [Chloroflexi bacterium]|nr:ABC transporter ATP-binding protein [Chloroflexota bacterium]